MSTAFLNVPGGRLAYDVEGPVAGPLVVCVPGMGDVRAAYRFLAPSLVEAGYRVATMDPRGQGESSTGWPEYGPRPTGEDVLALICYLGGPATVVGSSVAAASAIWAAAEDPDAVTSLVLVGATAQEVRLSPLMRLAVAAVGRSATLWTMFYRSLYPTAKPSDFAVYTRALAANLRQPGRLAALRALIASSKDECLARTSEVGCPVLIVMGTKDPDFADPAAEARLTGELLSSSAVSVSVELIEGAGHYPYAEMPETTASAVGGFLAGAVRA